jgi:hypothetical protein
MKKFLIAVSFFIPFLFYSCKQQPASLNIAIFPAVQIDKLPGTSPYLAKDHKGNLVLSWVRTLTDSSAIFCYSISTDGGRTFGKTVIIPPSTTVHPHSENLPKVIFKPSGEIIAVWGISNPNPKNKYSGLINYSQSFDEGKSWTAANSLVQDTASFDQRYSDVALLSNGEVGIIWLDNRVTTKDGAALYFSSTNGSNGFQGEKLISEPSCECCRTDLFVDKKNNIHVLYRGIIQDSIRDMLHAVSTDGGKSFSKPKQINDDHWVLYGCPHTGPAMTENQAGLHFAWFTGGGKTGSFYTKSTDNGSSFTGYDSISHLGRHPQLASFPNGELIIVWDESVQHLNQSNKRIGIQIRAANGAKIKNDFITPDSLFASYPVVSTLEKNTSGIAYCKKTGEKNYIMYQRVFLSTKSS